jgi:uroporphyrinogen-III synthase
VAQAPKEDDARRLGEARRVISIWTSGAAMQQLLETLPGDAWTKILAGVFIVISRRLARLARDLGASDVRLAEGPDNDSLARCALAAGKQP